MQALVLLFAGLKFGKIFLSAGSMLLSLALYAGIWGWRYAAGFMVLLLVHELGHVIAARQRGLDVSAPAFIPFMGAFITLRDAPSDVETEAYVAYGGPLLGSLAAFAAYFGARNVGSDLGLAVAYAGFTLNLFNLLPISPLDGGRITAVLGPRVWLLGVPLLLALFLYQPSPLLAIIALIALPKAWQAWRYPERTDAAYYAVSPTVRFEYLVMYLGLVVLLGLMSWQVDGMLAGARGN